MGLVLPGAVLTAPFRDRREEAREDAQVQREIAHREKSEGREVVERTAAGNEEREEGVKEEKKLSSSPIFPQSSASPEE